MSRATTRAARASRWSSSGTPFARDAISAPGRPAAARSARRRSRPSRARLPFLGRPSGRPPLRAWKATSGWTSWTRARLRTLAQERVDRPDVGEDVVALDGRREGRVARRPRGGLRGRVVGGVDRAPRRHREHRRPRRPEPGPGGPVGGAATAGDPVGQPDRHVDPDDAGPLRRVEERGDVGEQGAAVPVGVVQVEERARPGAAAAVQSSDPARHARPQSPSPSPSPSARPAFLPAFWAAFLPGCARKAIRVAEGAAGPGEA